ncbi:hypothetical protein BDP27DRAFT_1371823 [Rhodocollybia butyracea]|uniref:Uncharacterized protein n=1 Tax=Rhodocollybia butyracea TaxID=206335 RepID=A0A9P5P9B8_9AGAR|nr:hypothetical protein BDP27DRAFT_1371823 [Rhodocollybia butyracea]
MSSSGSESVPTAAPAKSTVLIKFSQVDTCLLYLETTLNTKIATLNAVEKANNDLRQTNGAMLRQLKEIKDTLKKAEEKDAVLEARLDELKARGIKTGDEERSMAFKDNSVKIFQLLMGVSSLAKKENIPEYPAEGTKWPVDTTSNVRLLRFQWEKKASDEPNYGNITTIMSFIRKKGAEHVPAATKPIALLSDVDLRKRCAANFNALRRKILPLKAKDKPEEVEGNEKKLSKEVKQSCQKGKLTVRIRKRAKLEGDDAKFKQSRYDGAFIANAMSEDEDEIVNGKKTGKSKRCMNPWIAGTSEP